MVDIHNHIIYDCDDGSESVEQSVRMLKAASEAGITDICFTPHYMEDGYKSSRSDLERKVDILKKEISNEGINMNLFLGEEIFIFPSLPEHLNDVICLNDSKYILFELPLIEDASFADDVIYKLFSYGKVPILAHPERYMITHRNFEYIERLVEKGVLMQINLNSLIGHYGKEAKNIAIKLLKEDMVQFVASDAHSSAGYASYGDSIRVLKKLVSEDKFKEITEDNQRKVLLNQDIDVERRFYEKKECFLTRLFNKKASE